MAKAFRMAVKQACWRVESRSRAAAVVFAHATSR
ncbi:hypothetical protein ACLK1T_10470 [Escherichia coli]